MSHRDSNTGESDVRRAPRSESQHDSSIKGAGGGGGGKFSNSNNYPGAKQHQTHMAPAEFRALSADKKREVRQQERNHKKEMKRSMNYFRHVGEALTDASAPAADASGEGGAGGGDQQARAGIVDGFSTELIKKLRSDFSLLYRSSNVCRTIEKALAAGASRAHVDALLYVFLGHMRDLLSTPKTSYLLETLFAALYHTVGMECQQRGGPAHLDDVVETPSAASTPSLKQLLDTFVEEICGELDPQTAKGGSIDWVYQRSAARGLASIIRALSGRPSRGAPAHEGVALHFAVQPISRMIRNKLCRAPAAFVEGALDNSLTFVLQALIASPLPAIAESWVKDIVAAPESVVPALLVPSASSFEDEEDEAANTNGINVSSNNGARVLEAAIDSCPEQVSPAIITFLKNNKKAASETSLFVVSSLIRATESNAEVLEMYKALVQPRLPGVLMLENASSELSALAKVVKRIHAVQGTGLDKPVKEIRTDVVHSIVEACRQVKAATSTSSAPSTDGGNAAAAAAKKQQHPLLILCGPTTIPAPLQGHHGADDIANRQQQLAQQQQRQRAAVELLDALLNLGLGPASMLVHTWEKIPTDQLRDFACTNVGSRALQLLVPHIAATKMTSKDVAQAADVLDPQNTFLTSSVSAGGFDARHQQHVTLQPNLQKLLRRLTNSELGDATCRTTRDFPTLKRLICNNFAAFLVQRIYDEAVLWLKAALVRRVAKLMENVSVDANVDSEFDPTLPKNNLSAKKLSLHLHVDQFEHRPDEWRMEAERAVGAKKLMSVILAAES